MMFFPNDAKVCNKKFLKHPNRTLIYKLTSSNFKCRRRGGGEEEMKEKEVKLVSLCRAWNS